MEDDSLKRDEAWRLAVDEWDAHFVSDEFFAVDTQGGHLQEASLLAGIEEACLIPDNPTINDRDHVLDLLERAAPSAGVLSELIGAAADPEADSSDAQCDPELWRVMSSALEAHVLQSESATQAAELEFVRAGIFEILGEREQAIERCREALDHQPNHFGALISLCAGQFDRGEYTEIIDAIDRLQKNLKPKHRGSLNALAADIAFFGTKDVGLAKSLLSTAASGSECRRYVSSRDVFDEVSRDSDRFDDSLDELARWIGRDAAASATVAIIQGRRLEQVGDRHSACQYYARAALLDQSAVGAYEGIIRTSSRDDDSITRVVAAYYKLEEQLESWAVDGSRRGAMLNFHTGGLSIAELEVELSRVQTLWPDSHLVASTLERARAWAESAMVGHERENSRNAELAHGEMMAAKRGLSSYSGAERAACHYLAARRLFQHSDLEGAWREAIAAFDTGGHISSVIALLRAICARDGNYSEFARCLSQSARSSKDRSLRAQDLEEAGLIYERNLNRPEIALACYRQALEQSSGSLFALAGIERLAWGSGDRAEIADALADSVHAGEQGGSELAQGWASIMRAGLLASENPDAARESLNTAKVAAAGRETSLAAVASWLHLILFPAESSVELNLEPILRTLAKEEELIAPESATGLLRLGVLLEGPLNANLQAEAVFDEALSRRPGSEEAARGKQRANIRLRRPLHPPWEDFPNLDAELSQHLALYRAMDRDRNETAAVVFTQVPSIRTDSLSSDLYRAVLLFAEETRCGETKPGQTSERPILLASPSVLASACRAYHHALARDDIEVAAHSLLQMALSSDSDRDASALLSELMRLCFQHPEVPCFVGSGMPKANTPADQAILAAIDRSVADQRMLRYAIDRRSDASLVGHVANLSRWAESTITRSDRSIALAEAARMLAKERAVESGELSSALSFSLKAIEARPDNLAAIYRYRDGALASAQWSEAYDAALCEARASRDQSHRIDAYLLAAELAEERLDDPQSAIEYLHTVLSIDETRNDVFLRLADLLERSGQTVAIVSLLENAIAKTSEDSERCAIHLRLAKALRKESSPLEERNGGTRTNRELAIFHLNEAITLDGSNRDALVSLAEWAEDDKRWSEAAAALERLLPMVSNEADRTTILLRLCTIYCDHLATPLKAGPHLSALLQQKPNSPTALRLRAKVYESEGDLDLALATLKRCVALSSEDSQRVDIFLDIAEICQQSESQLATGDWAVRCALNISPADLRAIGSLARLLAASGDEPRLASHLRSSAEIMRKRLDRDPGEYFAAYGLFSILEWSGDPDARYCAAQLLEWAGRDTIGGHQKLQAALKEGTTERPLVWPVEEEALSELDKMVFVDGIDSDLAHIFSVLSVPLAKYYRVSRSEGSSLSATPVPAHHPLAAIASEVAGMMGVEEFRVEIARSDANANGLIVDHRGFGSISVGRQLLEDATEEEIRFLMGRCLWLIRRSLVLPHRLTGDALHVLLTALIRNFIPTYPADIAASTLDPATSRIKRILTRRIRDRLEPTIVRVSTRGLNTERTAAAVTAAANRIGLLICGSLRAATNLLDRAGTEIVPPGGKAVCSAESSQLARFSVSENYFRARHYVERVVVGPTTDTLAG